MDRRTNEAPMEFMWTNGNGPVDEDSPFITAVNRGQGHVGKRSRSAFESPAKFQQSAAAAAATATATATSTATSLSSSSSFPSLRPAAGQTTLFSNLPQYQQRPPSPDKSLPQRPSISELFKTPRNLDADLFSSGGETPNSPDHSNAADSEATPDYSNYKKPSSQAMGYRTSKPVMTHFTGSSAPAVEEKKAVSPKKKRESLLGRLWSSPSRLELVKGYSNKAEHRVIKRRTRAKTSRRRSLSDSNSDDDSKSRKKKASKAEGAGTMANTMAAIFTYMEAHPMLPHVLSFYVQLLMNFFLVGSTIYLLYSFWATIQADVNKASEEAISVVYAEMASCKADWDAYHCDKGLDRTKSLCETLSLCMSKDPRTVARAQVSAKTFATIFNGFIEPISYKAMFVLLTGFAIFLFLSNLPFTMFRNRLNQDPYMHMQPPPPPTPQRHPSNGAMYYQTPYAAHQYPLPGYPIAAGLEPGPSVIPGTERKEIDYR